MQVERESPAISRAIVAPHGCMWPGLAWPGHVDAGVPWERERERAPRENDGVANPPVA